MNSILVCMMSVSVCVCDDASGPGTSNRDLATLTANTIQAYRYAEYLSFTARVEDADESEIRCEVIHARDNRVSLSIYNSKGDLIYDFRSRQDGDHVILQDRNYLTGQSEARRITLEDHQKRVNLVCVRKGGIEDCRVGMYLRSWVGEDSKHADHLEKLLPRGEYKGTEEVEGHQCDVISVLLTAIAKHIIYIDQHSYLAGKWVSINPEGTRRIRRFEYHKIEGIPSAGTFELPPLENVECHDKEGRVID